MRYLDLFAGYGGFSLGIQQAYETTRSSDVSEKRGGEETSQGVNEEGKRLHPISSETTISTEDRNNELPNTSVDEGQPHCIGFSEIDKYAIQTYQKHFPNHKPYGDITKINKKELPDFDLLVGGFPCQAFSIAGKRGGFEDTRGTLFFDIARILREKQPRLLLLENVKGILSHDQGRTFLTIITTLDELGYDVEWQVLNAKNFGVPQNRERVFIVGHLGGFGERQVFPIGNSDGYNTRKIGEGLSATITRDYYKGLCGANRQGIMLRDGRDNRSCLRAGRTPEVGFKGYSIRRLTPTECERLMGLPDGWTEYGWDGEIGVDEHGIGFNKLTKISDTQRYKLCGNGVVVNVVEEIIKRLIY